MPIFNEIKKKLLSSKEQIKIVYPEGWNSDIVKATTELVNETDVIIPILIFRNKSEIPTSLSKKIERMVIDGLDVTKYAEYIYDARRNKGISMEDATKLAKSPNFLGSTMVALGEADGEICGIEYSTADTLRAALQIVKPSPDVSTVCSGFIMEKGSKRYVFGDSSVNINPDPEQLASITKALGYFAKSIANIKKPRIAMLSYSTAGSGKGESVDKVRQAYEIISVDETFVKECSVFGEIQFDAAFDINVMHKKAKELKWDEQANVYVFPDINAGNIGYKIAQRLGSYQAIGPVILGLKKPVNDLSRGASASDVKMLSYITALQAIIQNK